MSTGFLAVTKNYSPCILFLPSKVTKELVNTIAEHEIAITIHNYCSALPFAKGRTPVLMCYSLDQ
jgi:hypothetical protein